MSPTAFRPSRRSALAGAAALAMAFAAPSLLRAAPLARIALYGPPAAPSIVLAHAIAAGLLAELAPEVTLSTWRTPDELRAGLTSGTIDLSVMPVQVAANLYNRGMGVGLVNSMTDGLLHVVAAEGSITDLAGLGVQNCLPGVLRANWSMAVSMSKKALPSIQIGSVR